MHLQNSVEIFLLVDFPGIVLSLVIETVSLVNFFFIGDEFVTRE